MFAGRSLHGISEGNILLLFLLDELLRDMLVDIVSWVGVVLERGEVSLNPIVKFLRQLPNGLVGFGIEVVVFFVLFVEEDLEGADQLVYFLCVHPEEICSYKYIIAFED